MTPKTVKDIVIHCRIFRYLCDCKAYWEELISLILWADISSLKMTPFSSQHKFFFLLQFTTAAYNQIVEPTKEATFDYNFNPSESFSSRPFGLTVLINYKDGVSTHRTAIYHRSLYQVCFLPYASLPAEVRAVSCLLP